MSSTKPGLDALSNYLSPVIRTVGDYIQSRLTGTSAKVLRIKKSTKDAWAGNSANGPTDVMGDFDMRLESELIGNIEIAYPGNKIELFGGKTLQSAVSTAVNPEEQLPIEFFVQFSGSYDDDPIVLVKGDLVIDYFVDENRNIIPIYTEVSQVFATLFGKNIVRKQGTLVPFRGEFEKSIKDKVSLYFAELLASGDF